METKDVMTYRSYEADIRFYADDAPFIGRIAGLVDQVGFHAQTEGDLAVAFCEAVDDYLEVCTAIGKAPA